MRKIQLDALAEQYLFCDSERRRLYYKQQTILVRIGMLMGGVEHYEGDTFEIRPMGNRSVKVRNGHLSPSQRRNSRRLVVKAKDGIYG